MPVATGAADSRERSPDSLRRSGWRVSIRMDDGTIRAVDLDSEPPLLVGDRVRVKGLQIFRR